MLETYGRHLYLNHHTWSYGSPEGGRCQDRGRTVHTRGAAGPWGRTIHTCRILSSISYFPALGYVVCVVGTPDL